MPRLNAGGVQARKDKKKDPKVCHCEASLWGSRGNLFFLKKKVRETYHLKKNILPRLNAGGVQARKDKKRTRKSVIASPPKAGVAISLRLLRRFAPRNDKKGRLLAIKYYPQSIFIN